MTPDRPPARLPPTVRRHGWWIAAAVVLPGLCTVAVPLLLMRPAPGLRTLWAIPGIPVACSAVALGVVLFVRWRVTRIRRIVQAASGRACTGCLYNLSGLGDTGTCPECGRGFDAEADRRSWERARML